jgi:Ca-activated chloride channel homolog
MAHVGSEKKAAGDGGGGGEMMDDLDALKAALQATPAPNADAKAAAMRLAMENFDRLQGSTDASRLTEDRPVKAGFFSGVFQMFSRLSSRQMLAGTASAVAIGLGVVVVLPQMRDVPTVAPTMPEVTAPVQPVTTRTDSAALADTSGDAPVNPPATTTLAKPAAEVAPVVVATDPPEEQPRQEAAPALTAEPSPSDPDADVRGRVDAEASDALAEAPMAPPAAAPQDKAVGGMLARRSSVVADGVVLDQDLASMAPPEPDTEAFANADANPVITTQETPVSTFSIDVDTASYAVIRQSLNAGQLPPPDAVRIEEMVNYFPYAYPAPEAGSPFRPTVTVMQTPWNPGTKLVHIALQGELPAIADRPPLNLVFLVDTSGSMDEPTKLPLLKQSLMLMLGQLRPQDQIAIVAYAGSAGTVLEPVAGTDTAAVMGALDRLAAGGSTAGAEGLALAYQVAAKMAGDGEVSRVLIATDGDFNVGIGDPDALKDYIAKQRDTGIYLSVLGFGRGNLDDATMQALAQNGNGQAAYIDTLNEARKVLVDQLTGELFPIANDVKIQVEWNPATVAEYRLIGYETRALRREDFNNDRVDAGEIGAGHTVTAIYEVTAPGSGALLNDPLRYGAAVAEPGAGELGFLRLRYKDPGSATSQLLETPIQPETVIASDDVRFGVAIGGFGQLLTGATYLGDWGWDDAIAMAGAARGDDPFGYRIEAVNLMRLAQTLKR